MGLSPIMEMLTARQVHTNFKARDEGRTNINGMLLRILSDR